MKKLAFIAIASAAIIAPVSAVVTTSEMVPEEREARIEEQRILRTPIAGISNKYWFNYRADNLEARKELANDLNGAGDMEDLRDAWDEFRIELSDNHADYVKVMAKHGYRSPSVTIEE